MHRLREVSAFLLMVVGVAMFARGVHHSLLAGMGWQGLVQSAVMGALVFALGLYRWRYWKQR